MPNAHLAIVEPEKITGYLLNPAHPDNGGKAAFFLALGFQSAEWPVLAVALCKLAATLPVIKNVASPHGCKYILDGRMETPCGKQPRVRTVWIVDEGLTSPRLVTAYPHEE
jgi:hypothetical protein